MTEVTSPQGPLLPPSSISSPPPSPKPTSTQKAYLKSTSLSNLAPQAQLPIFSPPFALCPTSRLDDPGFAFRTNPSFDLFCFLSRTSPLNPQSSNQNGGYVAISLPSSQPAGRQQPAARALPPGLAARAATGIILILLFSRRRRLADWVFAVQRKSLLSLSTMGKPATEPFPSPPTRGRSHHRKPATADGSRRRPPCPLRPDRRKQYRE